MTARATLADRRISSVERAYGVSVKGGSASCTVWRKRSGYRLGLSTSVQWPADTTHYRHPVLPVVCGAFARAGPPD